MIQPYPTLPYLPYPNPAREKTPSPDFTLTSVRMEKGDGGQSGVRRGAVKRRSKDATLKPPALKRKKLDSPQTALQHL